ncbi:hypothetical protein NHQ30_008377 [Ciborinia camelliae]|nr:hypothetical protein NHQ30_008377 [Ciborinia camelliae]
MFIFKVARKKYDEMLKELHPDKHERGSKQNAALFYNLLGQDKDVFRNQETYMEYIDILSSNHVEYWEKERQKRIQQLYEGRKPWPFKYNPQLGSGGNCTNWRFMQTANMVNMAHVFDRFFPIPEVVDWFWNWRIFQNNKIQEKTLEMIDTHCKKLTWEIKYKKPEIRQWTSLDSTELPFGVCTEDFNSLFLIVFLIKLARLFVLGTRRRIQNKDVKSLLKDGSDKAEDGLEEDNGLEEEGDELEEDNGLEEEGDGLEEDYGNKLE